MRSRESLKRSRTQRITDMVVVTPDRYQTISVFGCHDLHKLGFGIDSQFAIKQRELCAMFDSRMIGYDWSLWKLRVAESGGRKGIFDNNYLIRTRYANGALSDINRTLKSTSNSSLDGLHVLRHQVSPLTFQPLSPHCTGL